jgi:hypothetical protein
MADKKQFAELIRKNLERVISDFPKELWPQLWENLIDGNAELAFFETADENSGLDEILETIGERDHEDEILERANLEVVNNFEHVKLLNKIRSSGSGLQVYLASALTGLATDIIHGIAKMDRSVCSSLFDAAEKMLVEGEDADAAYVTGQLYLGRARLEDKNMLAYSKQAIQHFCKAEYLGKKEPELYTALAHAYHHNLKCLPRKSAEYNETAGKIIDVHEKKRQLLYSRIQSAKTKSRRKKWENEYLGACQDIAFEYYTKGQKDIAADIAKKALEEFPDSVSSTEHYMLIKRARE